MGWLNRSRKRARHDTPEGLMAEMTAARNQVASDVETALARGRDRIVSIARRMEALAERHGLTPAHIAAEIERDISQRIEEVVRALRPAAGEA